MMSKKNLPIHKLGKFGKTEIKNSGIPEDFAEKNHLTEFTKDDRAVIGELLNRDLSQVPKGPSFLGIPYYCPFNREELISIAIKSEEVLNIDGEDKKYLRPTGTGNLLYIPKSLTTEEILNPKNPIFIVEGEKKALCLTAHGFMAFAIGGVQNWKSKNSKFEESSPLEIFKRLNLAGRKLTIGFDNDRDINEDISKAETDFTAYLQSLGANVRNLNIPFKNGKKVGVDDYILEYGVEKFRKLLKEAGLPPKTPVNEITQYLSGLKNLSIEERQNKFKSALRAIADKEQSEIEMIIEDYLRPAKIKTKIARQLIEEIKNQSEMAKEVTQSKKSQKAVIFHETTQPVGQLLDQVFKHMIETKRYYLEDEEFRYINGKTLLYVNPKNIQSILESTVEFKINGEYKHIPMEYANSILNGPERKSVLPQISLFTDTVTYNYNFKLVSPGYNLDGQIYYSGKAVKPIRQLKVLHQVFGPDYCFANNASRTNAYGALLTSFLRHMWAGKKPLFSIMGNQPGIGKSTISKMITLLITGQRGDKPILWTSDEEELQKKIASKIRSKVDILNFDNIKLKNQVLESATLEMIITSDKPSFRLLNTNEMIEKFNTFVTIISLNDAKLGKDMLSRICPIEMFYDKDPAEREFTITDLEEWALSNRETIIGELVGAVENWKEAGCPLAKNYGRFGDWYRVIGGILEVNGFTDFMGNFKDAKNNYTAEYKDIGNLFYECLNKWKSLDELVVICRNNNLFKDKMNGASPTTALSILFKNMVDKEVPLPDGNKCIIKRVEEKKPLRIVKYMGFCPNKTEENGGEHE